MLNITTTAVSKYNSPNKSQLANNINNSQILSNC